MCGMNPLRGFSVRSSCRKVGHLAVEEREKRQKKKCGGAAAQTKNYVPALAYDASLFMNITYALAAPLATGPLACLVLVLTGAPQFHSRFGVGFDSKPTDNVRFHSLTYMILSYAVISPHFARVSYVIFILI